MATKPRNNGFRARCALATLLVLGTIGDAAAQLSDDFNLKQAWKDLVTAPDAKGGWADEVGARYGQVCDPWRQEDTTEWPATDDNAGCVAVWLSQRGDAFTVGDLPRDQQNNFQNTLHYRQAWNYHEVGFKSHSLPRPGVDINPVCYIANISGRVALGYEEGNGDVLMPCPGGRGGYDFSEESILNASDEKLKDMCESCYQAVCTHQRSNYPKACGGTREGGVNVERDNVNGLQQVSDAYHCHLTMANEGACDYVQYDQHEESRDYNMSSAVMCGWQNVRYLNLTYCDCTREAGTPNQCNQVECLKMALNGVVCGNCGNCNQETAYVQIFGQYKNESGNYDGVCALARTAPTEEDRRHYAALCSEGLFCRANNGRNRDRCNTHCEMFPESSVCPDPSPEEEAESAGVVSVEGARRLLSLAEANNNDGEDAEFPEEAEIVTKITLEAGSRKLRMV